MNFNNSNNLNNSADSTNLSNLNQGESATVLHISDTENIENTKHTNHIKSNAGLRQRLRNLGLIEGTNITCVHKSPLGDPTAYLIRGAVIALRSEDSSRVSCVLAD